MEPMSTNVIAIAETLNSLAMPAADEREADTPEAAAAPRRRRGLVAALAGTATAAALVWAGVQFGLPLLTADQPAPAATAPVAMDTAGSAAPASGAGTVTAPPPPVMAEVTGSGYVIAPSTITVYSPRTDRIAEVPVTTGQRVTRGQPLIVLEGTSDHFALERATIAHQALKLEAEARAIDLDHARAEQTRARQLAERGAMTQNAADEAGIAFEKAGIDLARARQALAQSALDLRIAQRAVDELVIRAPFDGTVTDLTARPGTTVFEPGGPELGESRLLTLIDTDDLVIDADFAERNIASFRQPVSAEAVLDAFPDQPFAIELQRIAAVASSQKGTITIRFRTLNPPAGTRPNMAVRIRVTEARPDKD